LCRNRRINGRFGGKIMGEVPIIHSDLWPELGYNAFVADAGGGRHGQGGNGANVDGKKSDTGANRCLYL
jgi:hypothetical protein